MIVTHFMKSWYRNEKQDQNAFILSKDAFWADEDLNPSSFFGLWFYGMIICDKISHWARMNVISDRRRMEMISKPNLEFLTWFVELIWWWLYINPSSKPTKSALKLSEENWRHLLLWSLDIMQVIDYQQFIIDKKKLVKVYKGKAP